ncbi:hypothetical protein ABFV99_23840 [Cytobacillus horneckiae]|uniref:hypothetical protein n=1 Tax=Cytobacillus horneckiae TaxID=549687 RepID=UPI0034CF7FAA
MGRLYKAAVMEKKLKSDFLIEKIKEYGVTESPQGIPLDQLDYESLKHVYVIESFKYADRESQANAWF